MKIYTQTYDLSKASPHRFWVAPYSEFKIGIKLLEKDEISDKDFTLKAGSVEFTPDEDKIDNFTLFTIKSNDTGFVEYTIEVEGVAEKLKLMQIVTDSTVFEVGSEGGGSGGDSYTKAQTDALLSAKADATKQLPADLTSWMTDGWYTYYEDPETGDQEQRNFTKLTAGFYDISPYCDYTVSAQYVYGWDGYYYSTRLFSYCTNGKTVFCHQLDGRDVMDGTDYEGNISGNPSCYFEVDTTKIPNDERLGDYLYDSSVVDAGSVKWFAYVSQNMDGNAPYTLQELTTFGDHDPLEIGDNEFYHAATGDVTHGFIEVSAVYDNQISSKVDQQYLQDNYLNSDDTYQAIDDVVNGALTAYYTKSETSSATELADAFANVGGGISIRDALDNGICLPQTIFENSDGTFGSLDLSGEVDFTEGRVGTGASILSNAVRVNIGTNISAFGGRTFGWTDKLTSLVIPESVTRFNTYEMFSNSKLDSISATVRIPDSVTVFGTGAILWNSRSLTIDFGDTRKTIPSTSNITSLAPGSTVYVPDSLYSTWIASRNWSNTGNTKILPRSAMTAAQKVGKAKTGQAPVVNTVHSVYETDWAALSATADANTFYVVLPDPE